MRKAGRTLWAAVCGAVLLTLASAGTALADEEASGGQWINMDKGPGVAQWVDENGVVTDPPGMRQEESAPSQGEAGDGQDGAEGQEGRTEETAQGETQAQEDGQSGETAQGETQAQEEGRSGDGGQTEEGTQSEDAAGAASGRTIDPSRPMVALTFDDGPMASVGNRIMDCLAQYGGKATFYVVGNRCASYGAEMRRMAAEGHEIGNHTYEHKYLQKLNAEQIRYQVNKGSEAIQAASGVVPATVRLPGGNKNATVLANVNAPMIMWSIDTLDWKTRNVESTVNKVLGSVKDGDVVLMHELYSQTGDAALQIIPALVERGYQLVTVSEMAQYRGGLENGKLYYSFRP